MSSSDALDEFCEIVPDFEDSLSPEDLYRLLLKGIASENKKLIESVLGIIEHRLEMLDRDALRALIPEAPHYMPCERFRTVALGDGSVMGLMAHRRTGEDFNKPYAYTVSANMEFHTFKRKGSDDEELHILPA